MHSKENFLFYLISWPFITAYDIIEYFYYMYVVPFLSGKPVADGWNPDFVKYEVHGLWKPGTPISIPYSEYIKMPNEDLMELGLERSKGGHLYRIASPQMIYANPEKAQAWGENAWKWYSKEVEAKHAEYKKELLLDPDNCIVYYDKLKYGDNTFFSYNIQMKVSFFNWHDIDLVEWFFSIIFFLCLLLAYFIFYHLYKLKIRLDIAEEILNENGFSAYETEEERSAYIMNSYWRESGRISETFDLGIELDYCVYEGTLIGFELFLLMFTGHIITQSYVFLYKYVYKFYMYNMELFTYLFFYFFLILSIYYWFRYKREKKQAIHRWVEIDYYFSHFLCHYFRTLSWLNLYKLVDDAPIFYYVLIYSLAMIWIYFGCDSCDYFMGWNQEYRIDIYNRQTNMHFWWPRVLMNQTWFHFYINICKPIHKFIIYVFLFLFLPILAIFLRLVYYQNRIHVYLNNKFFFWNSKRYTIDEIKKQWQKDRVINYVEEEDAKNRKGFGLRIL